MNGIFVRFFFFFQIIVTERTEVSLQEQKDCKSLDKKYTYKSSNKAITVIVIIIIIGALCRNPRLSSFIFITIIITPCQSGT